MIELAFSESAAGGLKLAKSLIHGRGKNSKGNVIGSTRKEQKQTGISELPGICLLLDL
jgi:hypothetical protein